MTKDELAAVLTKHASWRRGEADGARANLRGADLRGANLRGANLRGANLRGADLGDADLGDADLGDADLGGADLGDADLGGANLGGADLRGANLGGADLGDADLGGADLGGADLRGAYLRGADLGGAYLRGADLGGADLRGAYLRGADLGGADLRGAYLRGARNASESLANHVDPITPYVRKSGTRQEHAARYREHHPDVPVVENLDAKILQAIEAGGALDMSTWHSCETTHCRAGWAIHLAGPDGYALEAKLGGPELAGRAIYRASTGRSPYFYTTNERALEDIRRCAAEDAAPAAQS